MLYFGQDPRPEIKAKGLDWDGRAWPWSSLSFSTNKIGLITLPYYFTKQISLMVGGEQIWGGMISSRSALKCPPYVKGYRENPTPTSS